MHVYLKSEGHLKVPEVSAVAASRTSGGIFDIIAGKKMAVARKESQILNRGISDGQIKFSANK